MRFTCGRCAGSTRRIHQVRRARLLRRVVELHDDDACAPRPQALPSRQQSVLRSASPNAFSVRRPHRRDDQHGVRCDALRRDLPRCPTTRHRPCSGGRRSPQGETCRVPRTTPQIASRSGTPDAASNTRRSPDSQSTAVIISGFAGQASPLPSNRAINSASGIVFAAKASAPDLCAALRRGLLHRPPDAKHRGESGNVRLRTRRGRRRTRTRPRASSRERHVPRRPAIRPSNQPTCQR